MKNKNAYKYENQKCKYKIEIIGNCETRCARSQS